MSVNSNELLRSFISNIYQQYSIHQDLFSAVKSFFELYQIELETHSKLYLFWWLRFWSPNRTQWIPSSFLSSFLQQASLNLFTLSFIWIYRIFKIPCSWRTFVLKLKPNFDFQWLVVIEHTTTLKHTFSR